MHRRINQAVLCHARYTVKLWGNNAHRKVLRTACSSRMTGMQMGLIEHF